MARGRHARDVHVHAQLDFCEHGEVLVDGEAERFEEAPRRLVVLGNLDDERRNVSRRVLEQPRGCEEAVCAVSLRMEVALTPSWATAPKHASAERTCA